MCITLVAIVVCFALWLAWLAQAVAENREEV